MSETWENILIFVATHRLPIVSRMCDKVLLTLSELLVLNECKTECEDCSFTATDSYSIGRADLISTRRFGSPVTY
jgi:hypothetical protein